jgi:hypothetical protein
MEAKEQVPVLDKRNQGWNWDQGGQIPQGFWALKKGVEEKPHGLQGN